MRDDPAAGIAAWQAFLDEAEARVARARQLLDDGETPAVAESPFTPPALGPLPRALVARAEAVVAASAAVERALAARRDEVVADLRRLPLRAPRAAAGTLLDARA